jgi:CRP-like cAMP-binding protein
VPWARIRSVLLEDHRACLGWLEGLASQFVYTIDADRHNVFSGLPGRVANVILSYAEVFGRPGKNGVELSIPLSREQLARQVGSVKRSVLRVLKSFQENGTLSNLDSRLLIRKPERLIAETLPRRIGLSHRAGEDGGLSSGSDANLARG